MITPLIIVFVKNVMGQNLTIIEENNVVRYVAYPMNFIILKKYLTRMTIMRNF